MLWPTHQYERWIHHCLLLWFCFAGIVRTSQPPQPSSQCTAGDCPKGRKDPGVLLMQLKPKLHRAESNKTDQAEDTKPSCCSRCGGRGWCSPVSRNCHQLQKKLYYEPCESHPPDAVTVGALDWSDEFDGAAIDTSSWALLEGEGPPSLQRYTSRRDNAFVENGTLKIVAKCEDLGSWKYSSARLTTNKLREWGPGHRIEVRARAPAGRGSWPAVWMLPSQGVHGSWPNSGEIDIMETTGCASSKVQAAVQTGAFNAAGKSQKGNHFYTTTSAWHLYTLDWLPGRLKWYVDGVSYFAFAPDVQNTAEWPFNEKFFLNLHVAVLEIDYVRVYELHEAHA
ncbi:bglA [Symbiodinium natans]|uniref:BglA protein n=1 Tax=Symbiodinium natans TaxID=878477 RepID=A0A812PCZ6_9DINO|nr:bglA [Symbiodinium natans]